MRKSLLWVGSLALLLALTSPSQAQDTTTTTQTQTAVAQNPDGTWTVVAFPADKEVAVELTPTTASNTPAPKVRVIHKADGTTITLNPADFAGTTGTLNLYAVDQTGKADMLGPINTTGTAPQTFNTNMDRFMLVASPDSNLTDYSPSTSVAYRSAAPKGLAIVPVARKGLGPGAPRGEKVAGVATPTPNVPMLGIPTLPEKKETELKVIFPEPGPAPRANIHITPNFNNQGKTRVKAKLHDLSKVPMDAWVTLWAVGPDGKFFPIGSTQNKGAPNVATIDSDRNNTNVPFQDFGLFMTVEPTGTATSPSGTIFGTIQR
jgi:hypothetical protein